MSHHDDGETGKLILDGALTLRTADDVLARLRDMSARHETLEIDCDAAEEVDLSFIQLILAARTSAAMASRIVSLARPASGALLDALRRGGLLAGADQGFWLQTGTM